MKKWLDQYQNGREVKNSLNRSVTCSNCGWSWKLSDGGMDPMTCHKCGGTIKMKNGGEPLDEYQYKGEVKNYPSFVLPINRGVNIPKNAAPVPVIKQGYAPTPYSEYIRNERNAEYQRNKAMQNSDLARTFSSFTPGGDNIDAGVIGAEGFANLNPVMSGPILSASRLAPAILHPTNNDYWGPDRSIAQNTLGVLGAVGDVAMVSPLAPMAGKLSKVALREGVDLVHPVGRALRQIEKEGIANGLSPQEIKNLQMQTVGITSAQREGYFPGVSEIVSEYITPYSYDNAKKRILDIPRRIIKGEKNSKTLSDVNVDFIINHENKNLLSKPRYDAWRMYSGLPQEHGTFRLAETSPLNHPSYPKGSLDNIEIFSLNNEKRLLHDLPKRHDLAHLYFGEKEDLIEALPELQKKLEEIENIKNKGIDYGNDYFQTNVMGGYNKRFFNNKMEYNDIWDLDLNGTKVEKYFGKPFLSHGQLEYSFEPAIKEINDLIKIGEGYKKNINTIQKYKKFNNDNYNNYNNNYINSQIINDTHNLKKQQGGAIITSNTQGLDQYQYKGEYKKNKNTVMAPISAPLTDIYNVTVTDSNTGSFKLNRNEKPVGKSFIDEVSQNYVEPIKHFSLRKAGYRYMPGNLSQRDTTIDLTNTPMTYAKVNQNVNGNTIIGGEYIEHSNNTVRKAKDWLNAKAGDTYSDKKYPTNKIQSFYGVENGRFKVGTAKEFNPNTEIVPIRFGSTNINRAVLNDKEMRLLDAANNPIYQNSNESGKFILYSPSTKASQFSYISNGAKGVNIVNDFLKKNKDGQFIQLDNGRYDAYLTNPSGLTQQDFDDYYAQDWGREGNPGYNLIVKKNGGALDKYQDRGEYKFDPTKNPFNNRENLIPVNNVVPINKSEAQQKLMDFRKMNPIPTGVGTPITDRGNFSKAPINKQQLVASNKYIANRVAAEKENQKREETKNYKAAQLFHNYNPVAQVLGINTPLATGIKPNAKELGYGLGAGINDYYDIPGIGIVNDFVNPLSIVSKGIISPWEKAPLQAQESNSYLPYAGAALSTVLTAPMVRPASMAAKTIFNPANIYRGIEGTGKYLTEETALKNAYKLNPWAFKPNPENIYRGIGKGGMEDAFQSGVIRNNPNKFSTEGIRSGLQNGSFRSPYFVEGKDFNIAEKYANGYIAETPLVRNAETGDLAAYPAGDNWGWTGAEKEMPLKDFNILKKDWLRGYKKIQKPKMYSEGVPYEGAPHNNFGSIDQGWEKFKQRLEMDKWLREQLRFYNLPKTKNKESLGVLEDFKTRIQTPEGQKRLKELGIINDDFLQNLDIVEDPTTFGYYTGSKNKIVLNPDSPLPRKVTRHEIEHGVQTALQRSNINKVINGSPNQKLKALESGKTKIDDILSDLELRKEGTPDVVWDKSDNNEPVDITEYKSKILNKQRATDYFLTGSEGREKSAFLAEVQQHMMDKGVIPKNSYVKITPEMVKETFIDAMFDEKNGGKYLRLFNIMKPTENNYKLISKGLNKMLSLTPYAVPAAIGAGVLNQKQTGGPIITNRGQWDYPGQTTIIPSNQITMQGVNGPLYLQPNKGKGRLAYPNEEHYFPKASFVVEHPIKWQIIED